MTFSEKVVQILNFDSELENNPVSLGFKVLEVLPTNVDDVFMPLSISRKRRHQSSKHPSNLNPKPFINSKP